MAAPSPCWRGLYISPMYEITAQRFPSFKVSGGYLLRFRSVYSPADLGPAQKIPAFCPGSSCGGLAAILGGGLGNILDRVFRGYVVDMIATDFISFPVFNVADCFITCGAIGLLIHLALFNRSFWREEKKTENHHDADL